MPWINKGGGDGVPINLSYKDIKGLSAKEIVKKAGKSEQLKRVSEASKSVANKGKVSQKGTPQKQWGSMKEAIKQAEKEYDARMKRIEFAREHKHQPYSWAEGRRVKLREKALELFLKRKKAIEEMYK